jgi:hypothetical protein
MSQAERSRLLRQRKAAAAVPLEVVDALVKAAADMLLGELYGTFHATYGNPASDEPWSDMVARRDRVCARLNEVAREFKEAYLPAWKHVAEYTIVKLEDAVQRENEFQEDEMNSSARRVPGADVVADWVLSAIHNANTIE